MAGTNNSPFTPNADKVAQLTGSGAPVPGTVSPTFAAAVALAAVLQYSTYVRMLGVSTVSSTCTLTTAGAAPVGAFLSVSCEASASGTVTYTFGTGFKASATAAATVTTAMTVNFRGNGTNWVEIGRSLAISLA
jgi:type IV secretory pathway TrbL component